jgi:hypothetical protein
MGSLLLLVPLFLLNQYTRGEYRGEELCQVLQVAMTTTGFYSFVSSNSHWNAKHSQSPKTAQVSSIYSFYPDYNI